MNTILITGCNRGIGLEFVKQYAEADWQVHATCRNPDTADALKALSDSYACVSIHRLDVADEAQILALAQTLSSVDIDVLLNNAGVYAAAGREFGSVDKAAWLQAIEINTIAPLLMAQAFLDHLKRGERKVIATVSSKVGSIEDNSSGGGYAYRSSKSAVNQVMKSLSLDLAPQGIKTITLHPGWVRTDMGGPNALIDSDESVAGMRSVISNLSMVQTGQFLNYDGKHIPW